METTSKKQFEVAEIQLSYKTKVKPSQLPKITSSKDAYTILLENWDEDRLEFVEQFKVLLLNRANKVLGIRYCSHSFSPPFPCRTRQTTCKRCLIRLIPAIRCQIPTHQIRQRTDTRNKDKLDDKPHSAGILVRNVYLKNLFLK